MLSGELRTPTIIGATGATEPRELTEAEERAEERKSRNVVIQVVREGSYVGFRAPRDCVLGHEDNEDYKAALDGTRYRAFKTSASGKKEYGRVATMDLLGDILLRLRGAGFGISMESLLSQALEVRTAQQKFDIDALSERIDRFDSDEEFKKRTGGAFLFPHQKTGSKWLARRDGGLLADEQGVGKTLTVIAAFPAGAPVVVVCPSVAKGVWYEELKKWRPGYKGIMLSGKGSFRWPEPGEVIILNYDILPSIHGKGCDGFLSPEPCRGCKERVITIGSNIQTIRTKEHLPTCTGIRLVDSKKKGRAGRPIKVPFRKPCLGCSRIFEGVPPNTTLVADEAQALKNPDAVRTCSFRALSSAVFEANGRTWLMTGTPLENAPGELWAVLEAADLAAAAFGDRETFRKLFKARPAEYGFGTEWGVPEPEVVERLQRVSLRRMKADIMKDLPPKRWQMVSVDVDKSALDKCADFLKSHGGIDRISKLLELETIPFEKISAVRSVLSVAKIPAMLEIVQDFEDKNLPLLVFSCYKAPIDMLRNRQGWAVITGDESAEKKTAIAKAFQDGELVGLGLTTRAGGTAITLHRAANVLFVDLDWTPSKNVQAEDRAHRYGQKNAVIYQILKANHPLDDRVTEVLHRKTLLIQASVDASAVDENAPLDKEVEEYLAKVSEEISHKNVTRHFATSEEETKTLEELHRADVNYPTRQNVLLAHELAEEATTMGLSDVQWALGKRLISLATLKVKQGASSSRKSDEDRSPSGEDTSPSGEDTRRIREPVRIAARLRSPKEKPVMPPKKLSKPEQAMHLIDDMTDEEREDFIEMFTETWCVGCSEFIGDFEDPDTEHDCPADQEGDDENEEDEADAGGVGAEVEEGEEADDEEPEAS